MRIYNLSKPLNFGVSLQVQQREITRPLPPNNLPVHNLPPYDLYLNNSNLDKNLWDYSSRNFKRTLTDNYFQLPSNCVPDEYQKMAAESIFNGHDTLVTAPTGTGKTAIAYYAITNNLGKDQGKARTFYTTPLKALSNEKFEQLKKIYGERNVGLLTGDLKVNANAPIVVMTTEIYRNMVIGDKLKKNSSQLENLKTVIFDELHYLGDADRGGVWEQSIMFSDKKVQLLSLSATIGNNEEINAWISAIRDKKSNLINVPPEKRHVPLVFKNIKLEALQKKADEADNIEKAGVAAITVDLPPSNKSYLSLIEKLNRKGRLPACFFIFSKKAGKSLLDELNSEGIVLNSKTEQKEVQAIIDRYWREGKYLGEDFNIKALKIGYAIHNSDLLPVQKQLTEELAQKGLIKVTITTETMAVGINYPFKTTVITSPKKPTDLKSATEAGSKKRYLTPNEFHQMGGRAGRRGIDDMGFVYTTHTNEGQKEIFDSFILSKPNSLESHFSPDYSFIASYHVNSSDDDLAKEIFSKSLRAYDENQNVAQGKTQSLLEVFKEKRETLKEFGYITEGNTLTTKGILLSKLNGYHQIPIIDMIADKKFAGMTLQELTGAVASLASSSEKAAVNDTKPIKAEDNQHLSSFIKELNTYLEDYNEKMLDKSEFEPMVQDKEAAKHLFDWADLNSKSGDSVKNWKTLYNRYGSRASEGSLFKEIMRTSDLLKQISEIAETGVKTALEDADKSYYATLELTAKKACECLKKASRIF